MKNRVLSVLLVFVLAAVLTFGGILFARKTPWEIGCGTFNKVERGFPLPVVFLQPSVSNCWPVDSLSIFWKGGAYHEQYPKNLVLNFMFWLGLSTIIISGIKIASSQRKNRPARSGPVQ